MIKAAERHVLLALIFAAAVSFSLVPTTAHALSVNAQPTGYEIRSDSDTELVQIWECVASVDPTGTTKPSQGSGTWSSWVQTGYLQGLDCALWTYTPSQHWRKLQIRCGAQTLTKFIPPGWPSAGSVSVPNPLPVSMASTLPVSLSSTLPVSIDSTLPVSVVSIGEWDATALDVVMVLIVAAISWSIAYKLGRGRQ